MTSHRTPEFSPTQPSCHWNSLWQSIAHTFKSSLCQLPRVASRRFALLAGAMLILLLIPATPFLAAPADPPSPGPGRSVGELDRDLKLLEERQKIAIEGLERQYQHGFWFIVGITMFSSLLALYKQIQDQRLLKLHEDQIADSKKLGESYKDNLGTTIQLMNSVKGVIDFFKDAQDTVKNVKALQDAQTQEANRWERQLSELNALAIQLTKRCKRKAHNDPAIQKALRDFHSEYLIINRAFETKAELNANGHFLLAVHYRIEAMYTDALDAFAKSIELTQRHSLAPLRIPMMSISHSDLMPIRTERSDAGLSQCEIVIDIRQEFCLFSLVGFIGNLRCVAVCVFGR